MWIELLVTVGWAFVAFCAAGAAVSAAVLARHAWRALRWRRRLRDLLRGQPTQCDLDEHARRMRGQP